MEAAIISHVEGNVNTVLGKLGSLLVQESLKLSGVRDGIQELKDELESMNSFIRKHARNEDLNNQVKTWMKQVREIAYDTEDCIDEFMHRVGGPIEGGFLKYLRRGIRLVRTLKPRHEIASKIESLKTRIRSVSERHSRYSHIVPTPGTAEIGSSYVDPQIPALISKENEIAGIEDRTENLVRLLMNNVPDLRVISLVGFGGLGKTTLAMEAYESMSVKGHFECRARISVSQKFNLNVLLRDILKQIFPPPPKNEMNRKDTPRNPLENIENWNKDELIDKLKGRLNDKRYVIIIDDVWTNKAWDNFKYVLPNSNNGSRIIVTTRIKSVAESCSFPHGEYVYQIKPLSPEQSQKLFFKKVFGHSDGCPNSELKEVSNGILRKCGGMPLAIVSIAGLLSVRPNKNKYEWEKVYRSLGSELETNPSFEGIRKMLNLSYNDLPYHLKTCFLYMGIFPEDYMIDRKRLVRRWVAEGFVISKRGLSVEQVAESYFEEILNRNLIQAVDFSIDGQIKTFRVHDMILELIVSKSVEENFFSLIGDQYSVVPCDKIRRFSVQSSKEDFMNFGLYHARSLTLFVDQMHKSISLSKFGVLRVLDLENCDIEDNDLNNVGKLFLLKYLGLRNNRHLVNLPAQIRKLQHLETLDIKNTQINSLRNEVFELRSLKHLIGSNKYCTVQKLWSSVENMQNLETLSFVLLTKETYKSLENLKNLKKLSFSISRDARLQLQNIKLSSNLVSLYINCPVIHYPDGLVPNCIDSLKYLVKLTLHGMQLTDIDMQNIGTLPRLHSLQLYKCYHEISICFQNDHFPKLKLLKYILVPAIFEETAAPNLEGLIIIVPLLHEQSKVDIKGIENLLKLKEIKIQYYGRDTKALIFIDEMKKVADVHPNRPIFIEEEK